jgi:uncharacterized protein YbjT (DUF2867 family)
MDITVFGANGLTGRQLVRQALAAGHDVVAVTAAPQSSRSAMTSSPSRRLTSTTNSL